MSTKTDDIADLIGLGRRSKMEMVFSEHLPKYRNKRSKRISIQKLAKGLNLTRQAVNYWFLRERIPHSQINALISLPGSTLTLDILFPFSLSE